MSQIALYREDTEALRLQEGHFVALQFAQGWLTLMITGREPSNLRPYQFGGVSAQGNLSDYDELKDASNRHYLEPPKQQLIKQIFWGITPSKARAFFQYPSRQDRWSLIAVTRNIAANIGYIDGMMSPFGGPFSPKTEIWTVYQLYPAFQIYNPTKDRMLNVMGNFDVMQYTYKIITDKQLIQDFLSGKRRIRKHSVAGIDPQPATCPDWLATLNLDADKADLFAYTRSLGY